MADQEGRHPEQPDPEGVVDDLERKHVRTPDVGEEVDPASATHEGADESTDDEAGAGEPPD